jgi:hypothetical protein
MFRASAFPCLDHLYITQNISVTYPHHIRCQCAGDGCTGQLYVIVTPVFWLHVCTVIANK